MMHMSLSLVFASASLFVGLGLTLALGSHSAYGKLCWFGTSERYMYACLYFGTLCVHVLTEV